ncbi:MAG: DUF4239 domain-containing protein [Ignavibacteria bacterium]|jgi:hypothetical protein|nr:DUF4239 domain-containing protein [Ignavibacteria bacterium]
MINSFLELPVLLVFLITVTLGSGFSFLTLVLIRRRHGWESFKENHEVGGFLFNALGLIYAALIAFVVFATWEEYNTSLKNCEMEANMLQGLYLLSKGLPEEYQPRLRSEILSYIDDVINNDWPLLDKEQANPSSRQKLLRIWKIYESMDKEMDEKQHILFKESLYRLNDLTDYRRFRILSSQNHIPSIMWAVILIGALTSVGFSLFFGMKSFRLQALMTSLFVITNILIILLIANLDNPFSGNVKIQPDAFIEIARFIENSN